MNSVEAKAESYLTKDQRQTSAACSDYINNSRSMNSATSHTASAEATFPPSMGNEEVETWLKSEVHSDARASPEQLVAGSRELASDESTEHAERRQQTSAFADYNEAVPPTPANYDNDAPRGTSEDVYERQFQEEAMRKMQEASQRETRFSMKDLFNNPVLEDAAKQELRERPPVTPTISNADSVLSLPESKVSHMEQTVMSSENLDRDADRDVQAGNTEINSLLERLNIGKTSCTQLLKFVQKLLQTEQAYARSLLAVSRLTVSNVGQTDGFRYASECLCELPMFVRSAHSKVAQNLAESESSLNSVINKIKKLTDTLVAETPRLTQSVRSKRSALSKSKSRHQIAYKRMESIQELGTGINGTIDDPWWTEGQVAHDFTQLIGSQASVKKALADAYEKVAEIELLRLETSKDVISSVVQSYGSAMNEFVEPFLSDVHKAMMVLNEQEEITDLEKSKRNSYTSEQSLKLHYEEQEAQRCGELFSSPDIIRQGSLQILDEELRSWANARFILTKAGLYWYMEHNHGPRPDDFLVLSRTSIEQAKSPGLKLIQDGPNYFSWKRAVILRAATVEEYCEWSISLRETIKEIKTGKK